MSIELKGHPRQSPVRGGLLIGCNGTLAGHELIKLSSVRLQPDLLAPKQCTIEHNVGLLGILTCPELDDPAGCRFVALAHMHNVDVHMELALEHVLEHPPINTKWQLVCDKPT